jgi:hypothetical protein
VPSDDLQNAEKCIAGLTSAMQLKRSTRLPGALPHAGLLRRMPGREPITAQAVFGVFAGIRLRHRQPTLPMTTMLRNDYSVNWSGSQAATTKSEKTICRGSERIVGDPYTGLSRAVEVESILRVAR